MSLTSEPDYSGYYQEFELLQSHYGNEEFTRSILEVYAQDCPAALTRLIATIDGNDLEGAKHAIHSLANIMGIVGPVSSRPVIDRITANLGKGQLKAAALHAKELGFMVQAALVSIHAWLDKVPRQPASDGTGTKGAS
ncbi:MAG: hypothetical protein AB7T74_12265 [Clostridia bacterium]|jgi:hypothetical protein